MEWRVTEGDKRYKKGISALFGAETEEEDRERGVLRFNFPPLLIPILKDPRRFARLRTHFMIELSGKYAVTLYELLESVGNKDVPVLQGERGRVAPVAQSAAGQTASLAGFSPPGAGARHPADQRPSAGGRVQGQDATRARKGARSKGFFEVLKTKEREAIDLKLRDKDRQAGSV